MKIYGVALLAGCFLIGKFLGNILGYLLSINGDIGGVGFAMLLLIISNAFLLKKKWIKKETKKGILFWSSMYIPIIIAMSATLNVKLALNGGLVALVTGGGATLICFFLVPLLSKVGRYNKSIKIQ